MSSRPPKIKIKNSEKPVIRECLRCSKDFKSYHKFNRMCQKCKTSQESIDWSTWGGECVYDGGELE